MTKIHYFPNSTIPFTEKVLIFFFLHFISLMETTITNLNNEVVFEFPPFLRVYKDGRVERITVTPVIPPSLNPTTGVSSKDVVIDPESGVSARLYLPKITHPNQKFPLLVYYHGGAFCIQTPFSPTYHNYLNSLVSQANVVAVSVDYRRVPEHFLPVAYEDSWAALKWVSSHSTGQGTETWLNDHGDFDKVFLAGDSAGANIAHNMAIRAGTGQPLSFGFKLLGIGLVHPFFWGVKPIGSEENDMEKKEMEDKIWPILCPTTTGNDDPLVNPATDPSLSKLGCSKVLVCVAEKDIFRDRGRFYCETLRKSGWNGVIEIFETEGEDHIFHIRNQSGEKVGGLMEKLVSFFNQDRS